MNLEIVGLYAETGDTLPPDGAEDFFVALSVDIGEVGKPGAERFHFIAASSLALRGEVGAKGYTLVRGLILMDRFSVETVHRAVRNLINHTRALMTWDEVVGYFSRYSRYDSEDLTS